MSRASACAAALAAVTLLASCGGQRSEPTPTVATPPAPGPIIGGGRPAPRDPLSTAERAAATSATRRFLRDYLPYLYGRRRAADVAPVTPSVARTLRRSHARVPPAQAARRPRVASLQVVGQTPRSALATITVADGGPAPYGLSLTVERRGGRWLIADLGDDG